MTPDRKSTRLNSSHANISYAVFCLKKKKNFAAPPNTHICPVCLGIPRVLPVIIRAAVEAATMIGLALGFTIPAANKFFFFFNDTATTEIYTLSLHDALPI